MLEQPTITHLRPNKNAFYFGGPLTWSLQKNAKLLTPLPATLESRIGLLLARKPGTLGTSAWLFASIGHDGTDVLTHQTAFEKYETPPYELHWLSTPMKWRAKLRKGDPAGIVGHFNLDHIRCFCEILGVGNPSDDAASWFFLRFKPRALSSAFRITDSGLIQLYGEL